MRTCSLLPLTRIVWVVCAILAFAVDSSPAQSSPSLPPGHAESPEFRARFSAATADPTLQPWQRVFMRGLAGAESRSAVDDDPGAIASGEESGEWEAFPPPASRSDHTAIYDPVRDRMIVFGGYGSSYRNDVWFLSLSGTPAWSALTPAGTLPPVQSGHTAIYDPVRDRMVVFGGYANNGHTNGVWALSLTGTPAWSALTPAGTLPPARAGHTAIYDSAHDRMIVLGGYANGAHLPNDVWALNLAGTPTWGVLTPTGTPPTPRDSHTAIYDPVRERMIVFGGNDGSNYLNDVWTLGLAGTPAWSALTPTGTLPAARSGHSAIYDPVRDRMLVFGGYYSGGLRNDVRALSLNGVPAWSAVSPAGTLPPLRFEHSAVYDPVGDNMVVFGGDDGSGTGFSDDWALSLTGPPAWSALTPTGPTPSARVNHTAIYDPVRDRMVVFGGYTDYGPRNDVWALSLIGPPTWTLLTPGGTPPIAQWGHTAIYDPIRDRMIVFGGVEWPSDGLWALSLGGATTWSELTPTGIPPLGRSWHSAIYDPVRDRMIVFGGNVFGGPSNDVWELRLTGQPAWSELSPAGTPIERSGHSAIYDPVRDRMVVFGGSGRGGYRNDVWALSLSNPPGWSALDPSGIPPAARFSHTAVYDPVRDRMVVLGGFEGPFNDVWVLNLTGPAVWSEIASTATLIGLSFHAAIHDPVRDRMVVFGGVETGVRSDAWALNWSSLVGVEPPVLPVSPRFELAPPRPNPSQGSVSFDISIPHASPVSLVVYDSAGRVVHKVADAKFAPGRRVLVWDRRNEDGRNVPSGIYFVCLQAPGALLTQKTVLIQ